MGKLGADVLLLDLTGLTVIADYFVIATGESERQLRAITDEVVDQVRSQTQREPLAVEGTVASGWMLVDLGSVVVHIFTEAKRKLYDLEEFWSEARTVVRIA